MRDIGKNIKDLRIAKSLTQDQLAEKLFVTRQTVSNYENGKSHPDIETIEKIASVLDCKITDIIYGKNQFKKNYTPFIVSLSLSLFFITLSAWGIPYTFKLKGLTFISGPYYLFAVFIVPCAIFLTVWTFFELLSLTAGLKPITLKKAKYFKIALLVFITYFVLSNIVYWLPVIIYDFFTIADATPPISYSWINDYINNSFIIKLADPVIYFVYRYGNTLLYSLFAVFGAIFWLFNIPHINRNQNSNKY